MKKSLPTSLFIITGCLLITVMVGCKKISGVKDPVTLDKAAGKWSINAIHFNAYYGGGEIKDSIIPWKPILGNNVIFDGVSQMEYCFNLPYKSYATYKLEALDDSITITFGRDNNRLEGIDSLIKVFGSETSRWKISLLTSTNFNIEKTIDYHNAFPGASSVIVYQNFVR